MYPNFPIRPGLEKPNKMATAARESLSSHFTEADEAVQFDADGKSSQLVGGHYSPLP